MNAAGIFGSPGTTAPGDRLDDMGIEDVNPPFLPLVYWAIPKGPQQIGAGSSEDGNGLPKGFFVGGTLSE